MPRSPLNTMASGSTNRVPINDEGEEDQLPSSPKPPSPEPMHRETYVAEVLAEDDDVAGTADPPPPYPNSNRGSRRLRATVRSSRRVDYQAQLQPEELQVTPADVEIPGDSETSPLLPATQRRRRAASHSSTTQSVHSIGHTVVVSSRNVMSLFQAEPDAVLDPISSSGALPGSFLARTKKYFRPLVRRAYYSAIFHLLFINFPYELVVWIYLFVGTLVTIPGLHMAVRYQRITFIPPLRLVLPYLSLCHWA